MRGTSMIRLLIDIYIFILIADIILSYLPQYRHHPFCRNIRLVANKSCEPIRKILPEDLPFDFSPMIVILLLNLIKGLW
jgi:YggT family protein